MLKKFQTLKNTLFKKQIPEFKPMTKVYVAMCAHRGISPQVINNIRILEECPEPKIQFHLLDGDALIDRSRGRVATDFLLNSTDDILLFLDDDIVFNPVDIRKLILECQENDLDILGASYVTKTDNGSTFTFMAIENVQDIPFGKSGGIAEVRMFATGCMAIKRRVLQKMADSGTAHLCNNQTINFYPFFMPMEKVINNCWNYLSEDWAFCERARELGFKCWIDTTIKLGHIGPRIYDWDSLVQEPRKVNESIFYKIRIK